MAAKFPEDALSAAKEEFPSVAGDNCPICRERQSDPRVLPCQHTFCALCIDRFFRSLSEKDGGSLVGAASFPCPVCRQSVTVDLKVLNGEEEDQQPDPMMRDMAARMASQKRVYCDVCRYKKLEVVARDHCTSCGLSFCERCKRDHDRHYLFQTHSAIPVTQMAQSVLKCEQHEAEHVRYYCATCLAPLCTVCAVTDHVTHETTELLAALGNKKETIQSKIAGMSEKVMKYEELLARLEDVQSIREAAMKKTKLEIERQTNSLLSMIHQRKQYLLEEVDRYHEASIKAINIERDNCSLQLANMKSLWKFAAKLTEPGQSIQLLAMYGDLAKMAESFVRCPEPRLPRDITAMLMFVPKEQLTVGDLQKCEMSADLISRVSSLGDIANGIDSSRAASPAPFISSDVMTLKWQTPRLLWKADKTGPKIGEINEVYDVAITPNGTVIAAEWLNQRLQVFDATGFSRDVIGQGQVQPWGVALTRDGHLAVTDEKDHTVKIFNIAGTCLGSWKKMAFGWARGIVVNQAGQFIVTDTQHGKHTVSIHLPDGQCIRQIGSQGSSNEQFHWPRYVTVDRFDRIIVSDSSNHCVKVFDPTGHFLFKFGSIGSGDGHMKHPRGVCVDPNGGVIVADQDNNRVTLFNPDGRFVRHLLGIHRPWGVAISEGGLLAVSHKPSLSLYKVFDPMP